MELPIVMMNGEERGTVRCLGFVYRPAWCFLCPTPIGYKKTRAKRISPTEKRRALCFVFGVLDSIQPLGVLFSDVPYHFEMSADESMRWVILGACDEHEVCLEHFFGLICEEQAITRKAFDKARTRMG